MVKSLRHVEDFDYKSFLDSRVNFNGQNISNSVRKLCTLARAVIEKPMLVLLFEESLNFGRGVKFNFSVFEQLLPESTIISITSQTQNIHAYNRVVLIDNGSIIDKGEPKRLLSNPNSFLYAFLHLTDKAELKRQMQLLNIEPLHQTGKFGSENKLEELHPKGSESNRLQKGRQYSTFRLKEPLAQRNRSNSEQLDSSRSSIGEPEKIELEGIIIEKARTSSTPRNAPSSQDKNEYLYKPSLSEMHQGLDMYSRVLPSISQFNPFLGGKNPVEIQKLNQKQRHQSERKRGFPTIITTPAPPLEIKDFERLYEDEEEQVSGPANPEQSSNAELALIKDDKNKKTEIEIIVEEEFKYSAKRRVTYRTPL